MEINAQQYLQEISKNVKKNPVHMIVDFYLQERGLDHKQANVNFPRLCGEAKKLLNECGGKEADAIWCIQQLNRDAKEGGFSWTIQTAIKYKYKV